MSDEAKKYLAIGLVVICLGIAGFMVKKTLFPSSGGGETGNQQIALICKTCGGFEIPMDQFREMMSKQGPDMMMMGMPGQTPAAMTCPKCSNKTCYMAQKCPNCENIFVFGQARDQNFPDRCPKCGKSRIEEMQKGN